MDKVTLNNKEQKRLMALNEVLAGRFTGQEAAKVLGLSLRQSRRLLVTYRQAGAEYLELFVPAPSTGPPNRPLPSLLPLTPSRPRPAIPAAPKPVKPSPDYPWRNGWRSDKSKNMTAVSTPQHLAR